MHFDLLHAVLGVAFLAVWAIIGRLLVAQK
jgi:hypothetical protein